MRKSLFSLFAVTVFLTACSSSPKDSYEKRVYEERERQEKFVERSIDRAPKWMTDLPKSTSAVYASGTAVSGDYNMAKDIAETNALRTICMAAGGTVRSQTKVFRADSESASSAMNTTAIKSMCPDVDITGVERAETKLVQEGTRYRAYVLMALPTGEANVLATTKERNRLARGASARAEREFKELDKSVESVKQN